MWSAQTAALKNYIDDELESRSVCLLNAICISEPIHSTDSFLQLDISLVRHTYSHCIVTVGGWTTLQVFGWLTMTVWIASLWFLFKDTTFFNDPRAPWANYKKTGPPSGVQQNPMQGEPDKNGKSTKMIL